MAILCTVIKKILIAKVLFLCICGIESAKSEYDMNYDPFRTIIWGPGLEPEKITHRARYFFIQLVDYDGHNVTESYGAHAVTIIVVGLKPDLNDFCRSWAQILDSKDGSYIVRYKLHDTCVDFEIKILIRDILVKHERFEGPIFEEDCHCPVLSMDDWLENNQCNTNHSQMINDLKPFPEINFDIVRHKIISRYNRPHGVSMCHYVIKSNRIYRQCYGEHVGYKTFVDDFFLSLSRKVYLPDVEFFMNLGDWPLVPNNKEILPIFSWCGSDETSDIILPTYDIAKSSKEAMTSVIVDIMSVQSSSKFVWEKKIDKLFWRGRDSSRERLDLIDIARKHPDLIDAAITNFFFFTQEKDKYGPTQKHVSFFDFFDYKYQLNLDGTVAAYRFPYLLAGDSVVLKQKSNYYEFFYKDLEPNKHYIPVNHDLSNLVDQLKWAMNNEHKMYKIRKEARQFVRDNLMPQHIYCYYGALIKEFRNRIKSKVQVLPNMEEVPRIVHGCNCINGEEEFGVKDEL